MHRRCCWPPERLAPDFFLRSSLTSSQSAACLQRALDRLVEDAAVAEAVELEAAGDVVVDRHGGEGVGALEDHADAAADLDRRGVVVDVDVAHA